MHKVFASCPVLYGYEHQKMKSEILVFQPHMNSEGEFICRVEFRDIEKYSKDIFGEDEIHALDCAITFLNGVRNNSKDPEFFFMDGSTMFVHRDQ